MTLDRPNMKVLIVDDHEMVRDGIRLMLGSQNKYEFEINEAGSGEKGIEWASINKYDLIVMDYQLPKISGSEATKRIMEINPEAKILAMSNYDEQTYIKDILKAGAKGYVLKNIGPDELIKAFEAISQGGRYFSNEVATKLIDREGESTKTPRTSANKDELNNREKSILALIANEYTNEEISKELGLTKATVDKYRQNLLKKLGVTNTAGLTRRAIEMGLVTD